MMVRLEPLTLLAALSQCTTHIGLGATVSTTYSEPYNVARAGLDRPSEWRPRAVERGHRVESQRRIKARLQLSRVFVTHDLRVALQVCDRIAVIRGGDVVEIAPTAGVFSAPKHAYTEGLFAAVPGALWKDRIAK